MFLTDHPPCYSENRPLESNQEAWQGPGESQGQPTPGVMGGGEKCSNRRYIWKVVLIGLTGL